MFPIFEQGKGNGLGISYEMFLQHFISICENHQSDGRAKAFAFIFYNFEDSQIRKILKGQGGFAELDRLSGETITVFYLNSKHKEIVDAFNKNFLYAFDIHDNYQLPYVVFFKIDNHDVKDIEIVLLAQSDVMYAFHELFQVLKNYKENIEKKNVSKISGKNLKNIKVIRSLQKILVDKLLHFLVEEGIDTVRGI